jgi:hypothetical protein
MESQSSPVAYTKQMAVPMRSAASIGSPQQLSLGNQAGILEQFGSDVDVRVNSASRLLHVKRLSAHGLTGRIGRDLVDAGLGLTEQFLAAAF